MAGFFCGDRSAEASDGHILEMTIKNPQERMASTNADDRGQHGFTKCFSHFLIGQRQILAAFNGLIGRGASAGKARFQIS